MIVAFAMSGGVLSALPVSTPTYERSSDIWSVVGALPIVAERSVFIVALGTLGGAAVALLGLALTPRQRALALGMLVAFSAAHMATALPWQRYLEPIVLIVLPLVITMAAMNTASPTGALRARPGLRELAGVAALVAALSTVTLAKFLTKEERASVLAPLRSIIR